MLKKTLAFLSAFCLAAVFAAEEKEDPSLLFEANFNNFDVTAQKAAGWKNSPNFKPSSLMLRMHAGVAGQGNALSMSNAENCRYSNYKNFDPKQGTVSLWVLAKNWVPSKEKFQIFFQSVMPGGYRFLVYKFIKPDYLLFVIIHEGKTYQVTVPLKDEDWTPNRWHKLDAVWDSTQMALYLDGVLARPLEYTKNPVRFRNPVDFPPTQENAYMHLGADPSFNLDKNDQTAYDELKIYDRPLSPQEIREEYEKFYPPVASADDTPILAVPKGNGITLDGVVDPAEWKDAALVPIINTGVTKADIPYARMYLKQDEDNFLVAAEIFAPSTRHAITGGDLVDIWRDDAVELHLSADVKTRYQFILNSNGALYDASAFFPDGIYNMDQMKPSWNSGAKAAAKQYDGRWSAEIVIPKKSIRADTPAQIRGNLCVTNYGEKAIYATWGIGAKQYFDAPKFGLLLFGLDEPPVRFEKFGDSDGEMELKIISETPLNIRYVDDRNTVFSRPGAIPRNESWKAALPVGGYRLRVNGKHFRYTGAFAVNLPLEVTYRCFASRKTIECLLDLGKSDAKTRDAIRSKSLNAVVTLEDRNGKVYSSVTGKAELLKNKFDLPLPENPEQGTYQIKAKVTGPGIELTSGRSFRVPDMTPYQLRVGVNHTVPSPWTKIERNGNSFHVWNRVYTFGKGPFPVSIRSGKDEMLPGAPVLSVDSGTGKKEVVWEDFQVAETHDDVVKFSGKGTTDGLQFTWQGEFWFDGMSRSDISMEPAAGKTEIRSLSLEWTVPAEFARKMLDPLYTKWNNRDGEVFRFAYSHPADFLLWNMGLVKGLCWWPQSEANWVYEPGAKQFTVSRKGDRVSIRADLISQKAVLTKKADYTMAFMATPGRPLPARWRDFNCGNIWGYVKHENIKIQGYGNGPDRHPWATEPWTGFIPYDRKAFQKNIDDIAAHGSRFMVYGQPCYTASIEESYDYFFPEWEQKPGLPVGQAVEYKTGLRYDPVATCGHTGSGDLFAGRCDQFLKDYPMTAGLYFDISEGRSCYNTLHGHGGVDAFGKSYSSSNLPSLRDFFIRIARIVRSHGPDKILFLHAHNRFVPFVHGLGDLWLPGEQYNHFWIKNVDSFYTDDIPLEEWQSAYYAEAHGSAYAMHCALWMYPELAFGKPKGPRYDTVRHTKMWMVPCLLHDINVTAMMNHFKTVERWFVIKHDIDLAAAKFRGYWFSDAVKSASPRVYVSWYEWEKPSPWKRLLVIGNMGGEDRKAALSVDWKKLGVDPEKAVFRDLWEDKPVSDLDSLTVGKRNFLLIGIAEK
ncbi:MAG: hypothetical protein BWY31_00201 [Lentisphaerae bacterium ADurb.Bin242]|nr:MAG: hypothetical protein BWY31_00201 [Lentisphaerae bacterium ADurb.Bin242]